MRKKNLSALILLSFFVSSFIMAVPEVNASAVSPTNEQKPYVLTKDETGEVVQSWDVGEENDLVNIIQSISNDGRPMGDGTIPPQGPHTLEIW